MSNELNWFHIQRWNRNRRSRQMHDFEKRKQNPKDTDLQVLSMLANGNVKITRKEKEETDTDKKVNKEK